MSCLLPSLPWHSWPRRFGCVNSAYGAYQRSMLLHRTRAELQQRYASDHELLRLLEQ